MADNTKQLVLELTSEVISAYLANNSVPVANLPDLIASIATSLSGIANSAPAVEASSLSPAVNPKRSVTPDYIVCLDDGKKFKSLKRHLSVMGTTPAEYRAKWNLPRDYPMVAPNYAAQRSELAKKLGLGRKAAIPASDAVKPKSKSRSGTAASAPAKAGAGKAPRSKKA